MTTGQYKQLQLVNGKIYTSEIISFVDANSKDKPWVIEWNASNGVYLEDKTY